ncbi:MAG: hypothetical protein PHG85_05345 [Candidatus Altiarchaeota archaeon]|nr:hypothetical protein [Candidatus Altiarchaeota archaeon]
MKLLAGACAVIAAVFCLGCLCAQPEEHFVTGLEDGTMEYRSKAHGGYSFRYSPNLTFNNESSFDTSLSAGLSFGSDESGALYVSVMPDFVAQSGWLEEACDADKLARELKSQKDINITKVDSVAARNFTNVRSCIAKVVAVERGIELPMVVAFGECKARIPLYAVSGGDKAFSDMELVLMSFDC